MILVIDTSSARSAVALVDESGRARALVEDAPRPDLARLYREQVSGEKLNAIAVATGPGSFTGLRVGVAYGLGLAIGLRIPIVPLPTLALQAARSTMPVTAISEAGRGRVYYQAPGGEVSLGEPADVPTGAPLVGWVTPKTESALRAAGHVLADEAELRSLGEAAAELLKSAREVPYESVKLDYMQSFSARG